jgi:hypothetical protein
MAGPGRRSVTLALGVTGNFLSRILFVRIEWRRNAIAAIQPVIKIKQLASFTAERAKIVTFPHNAPLTDRAAHDRSSD